MKSLRPALALLFIALVAASATAQGGYRHRMTAPAVPANPQALSALQQDLITAIEEMKSALPIYDGNRVRAINQAHLTLLIVDKAIAGVNAMKRVKPSVTDHVPSGTAHSKYTAQEIQASQTSMRKGYAALQQAWKDMQTAAGSNPNKQAINASKHLQTSQSEANTAIGLHASQG